MRSFLMIFAAILITGPAPAAAQCQSIPDRIAARSGAERSNPLEVFSVAELKEISLEEVIAASDVVVEGTVQPIRTYLSKNRCTLQTDYAVTVMRVHRGAFPPSTKPGAAPPLTVTTEGGETTIDGVRVIATFHQLRPFVPGQHVLLLLTRKLQGADVTFEIAHGAYGAFASDNGSVKHLLNTASAAKFADMEKTAFVAKVSQR